jgi:predicted metal-dependent phosphoesterase TrpH
MFSPDSNSSIEAIVRQAYEAGLDGFAITDHNTVKAFFAAQKVAKNLQLDLTVIPGIEISTRQGHIIALGIEDALPAGLSADETINRIHIDGGIAVAPHPFTIFRNGIGSLRGKQVDAIEIFNSRSFFGIANYLAARSAVKLGVGVTGGSDSHKVETVGLAYTDVKMGVHATIQEILYAIKEGRSQAKGRVSPRLISVTRPFRGLMDSHKKTR